MMNEDRTVKLQNRKLNIEMKFHDAVLDLLDQKPWFNNLLHEERDELLTTITDLYSRHKNIISNDINEDIIMRLQDHEQGNDVETYELLQDATKEIKTLRQTLDSLGEAVLLYLLDINKESVQLMNNALDAWESYKENANA